MGVDVQLYAEGPISDDELSTAEAFISVRISAAMGWRQREEGEVWLLRSTSYEGAPRVEVSTPMRYYGPGYERGDWPAIYGAIRLMRAAFPDRTVCYGGDTSDEGDRATDEMLADLWDHFLGPRGDDYHARNRRWNAEATAS